MVGGSTRMPHVQQAVGQLFGREPLTDLNPDEVVALGAAIQANQLAGNNPDGELLLLDVIPLSLGIETMGGLVERIVPRNQTIPTAMAQDFTTYRDGQTALALHVVQGERDLVADCRSLARFELRGIPPMAAGAARIRVTFTVDADGLLQVGAREQGSGVEASIEVKPSYGLNDDDIARMLQDSFSTAEQDMKARALAEARLDVDRLWLATQSALHADGDLLSAEDRTRIDALMAATLDAKKLEDAVVIEAITEALAKGTEAFAAQRMNRGIQHALAGQNIENI
jgi:molecular chaperone HscA